jgi:uncharacterized RDD family membrane protein YckC
LKLLLLRHPLAAPVAFAIVFLLTAVCCRAATPDLFAAGDADGDLWLTQVADDVTVEGTPKVSIVRYRGPQDRQWSEAARINGRTTGIAVVGSQLAVLQDTGEWLFVWPGGSISGPPLPNRSPMRTIGSDGQTLWAVGIVTGALTTQPATTQAVETMPIESPAVLEPRAVLFRLDRDQWIPVGRINAPLDAAFAITGNRGEPIVAARNAVGTVRVFENLRHTDDITIGDASVFSLFYNDHDLLLWTAGPTGAGEIQRRGKSEPPVSLKPTDPPVVRSDRALAIAAGRLRLFFLARAADAPPSEPSEAYEQMYDLAGFAPVGKPEEQIFPVPAYDSTVLNAIRAIVLAGMILAMVISYHHRQAVREMLEEEHRPEPAPLYRRAAAGMIDLLPMIACGYLGFAMFANHPNPNLKLEAELAAGPLGYLVYTTAMELLVGKTVGKLVLGLKVVRLDGAEATRGMLLRRNLLRVVDLFPPMLLLVIASPLRQRVGDIAAETLVIVDAPQTNKESNNEPRTK